MIMTTVPAQFEFIDGGDANPDGGNYYTVLGVTGYSEIALRNGKYWFIAGINDSPGITTKWVPRNGFVAAQAYAGALLTDDELTGRCSLQFVSAGGNVQVKVVSNPNGSLSVFSGSTLLGTTALTHLVLAGVPFFLEGLVSISTTTGAVTLWLNDNPEPVFTVSGVDTAADTSALNIAALYWDTTTDGSGTNGFRDGYIHDGTGPAPFNARLGQGSAIWLPVSGVISNTGFLANGGSTLDGNAATTPPNPTVDFDSAPNVGNTMTLGLTPMPDNVIELIAARPMNFSYKTDTGVRALQNTMNFGSSPVPGTSNYLAIGPVCYPDEIITTDAATGVLLALEGATGISALNAATLTITVTA
jgi:hypothetical protein